MAEFLLSSIMIRIARNGSKYITGKLKNKHCPGEKEFDFINFSQEMVKILEPYLSKTRGGIAEQDKNIPTELRTITGCWLDYPISEVFSKNILRIYPLKIYTKEIILEMKTAVCKRSALLEYFANITLMNLDKKCG